MLQYPKILLLCSLNQNTANGITIANLFSGWPSERIAVVEFNGSIEDIYVQGISRYYLLGEREIRFIRPFNLLRKFRTSRTYDLDEPPPRTQEPTADKKTNSPRAWLKQLALRAQRYFLHKSGLVMVSRKLKPSPDLDQWVHDFNPDVVYATTGDICKLDFICDITERYGLKLVIHVFDDFVNSKYQYTTCPSYWRHRLDDVFRRVVKAASLHLAISEKMTREYTSHYKQTFYTYHNPIDTAIWLVNADKAISTFPGQLKRVEDISPTTPFTFVYAGKVNRDTQMPILDFINACKNLSKAGCPVKVSIFSPYPPSEVRMLLGDAIDDVFMGRVDYEALPDIFRTADSLLLPLDSSPETIRYIRLSMLTKATEYMISGTPIFLFAPNEIAVSEYLLQHDAAFHVENRDLLEERIVDFIRDADVRSRIAQNAYKLALQHHLQTQVSHQLHNQIGQLCFI